MHGKLTWDFSTWFRLKQFITSVYLGNEIYNCEESIKNVYG